MRLSTLGTYPLHWTEEGASSSESEQSSRAANTKKALGLVRRGRAEGQGERKEQQRVGRVIGQVHLELTELQRSIPAF